MTMIDDIQHQACENDKKAKAIKKAYQELVIGHEDLMSLIEKWLNDHNTNDNFEVYLEPDFAVDIDKGVFEIPEIMQYDICIRKSQHSSPQRHSIGHYVTSVQLDELMADQTILSTLLNDLLDDCSNDYKTYLERND